MREESNFWARYLYNAEPNVTLVSKDGCASTTNGLVLANSNTFLRMLLLDNMENLMGKEKTVINFPDFNKEDLEQFLLKDVSENLCDEQVSTLIERNQIEGMTIKEHDEQMLDKCKDTDFTLSDKTFINVNSSSASNKNDQSTEAIFIEINDEDSQTKSKKDLAKSEMQSDKLSTEEYEQKHIDFIYPSPESPKYDEYMDRNQDMYNDENKENVDTKMSYTELKTLKKTIKFKERKLLQEKFRLAVECLLANPEKSVYRAAKEYGLKSGTLRDQLKAANAGITKFSTFKRGKISKVFSPEEEHMIREEVMKMEGGITAKDLRQLMQDILISAVNFDPMRTTGFEENSHKPSKSYLYRFASRQCIALAKPVLR